MKKITALALFLFLLPACESFEPWEKTESVAEPSAIDPDGTKYQVTEEESEPDEPDGFEEIKKEKKARSEQIQAAHAPLRGQRTCSLRATDSTPKLQQAEGSG